MLDLKQYHYSQPRKDEVQKYLGQLSLSDEIVDTDAILEETNGTFDLLEELCNKIEIHGRILTKYYIHNGKLRAAEFGAENDAEQITKLGIRLLEHHLAKRNTKFLNAAIKIYDFVSKNRTKSYFTQETPKFTRLLASSLSALNKEEVKLRAIQALENTQACAIKSESTSLTSDVPFAALSVTERSRYYLREFAKQELQFSEVKIFGTSKDNQLNTEIISLANQLAPKVEVQSETGVTDYGGRFTPGNWIYSGLPGEILSKSVLSKATFIHSHSGCLPQYRGSTTLFYMLMDGLVPSATAFEMSEEIDMGSQEFECKADLDLIQYSKDIDHAFDGTLRARTIAGWLRGSRKAHDSGEPGRLYFVIHPVLKSHAINIFEEMKKCI